MKAERKWQSRLSIILAGVTLGFVARLIWPPPIENSAPPREFLEPLTAESIRDLPILPVEDDYELPFPYENTSQNPTILIN